MANQAQTATRSPKDERRDAIIAIGEASFAEHGYAGTSMSAIAARLGGSKGTLYNYFKSKEELFIAMVEKKCAQLRGFLAEAELESGGDLRAGLTRIGTGFIGLVLLPETISTYRLVTAECERFPEVGRALYDSGVRENQRRMVEFLEHAKQAGQFRKDADTVVAAEQFFDLCLSGIHRRRLWNITRHPTESEMRANVANAVNTFMRAFGE
jgi:AcrR family transcriptional regulator